MSQIKETVAAIFASRGFAKFFSGVEMALDGQDPIILKITTCRTVCRSEGYRLARYSKVTEIRASNGINAFGFGEHDLEVLALQKSIAEAVERCVYKTLRNSGLDSKSSNGWAAHLNEAKAFEAARNELFERDAALLHWLSSTPLKEIPSATWPKAIKEWASSELALAPKFNQLRILVSHLGLVPVVTTIIHDGGDFGFMSQSGGKSLEDAIYKALAETCRISDLALRGEMVSESGLPTSPEGHALHYAFHEKIPTWLFGAATTFSEVGSTWNVRKKHTPPRTVRAIYNCGPLVIARCTSPDTQNLFFGSTEVAAKNGLINFERLKDICGMKILNIHPHFVP